MRDVETLLVEAKGAFRRNEYGRAHDLSRRAEAAAAAAADGVGEAVALGWAGAALAQLSRYQEAMQALRTSVDSLESHGRPELAAHALNYMGVVLEELGNPSEAFRLYRESLERARQAGDPEMEVIALGNAGEAHVSLGDVEAGLPLLAEGHERAERMGDLPDAAWCLWAMARGHAARGRDAEAVALFTRAVELADRGDSSRVQAETRTGLGTYASIRGDHVTAIEVLTRALELAERAGVRREVFNTNLALSEAYERAGDPARALEHHKRYHQVRSEVADETVRAEIGDLTARFDLERARQRHEIDQLRNVELARALEELRTLHGRLEQQAAALRELSVRDGLTGAYNRRHLDERLPVEFERARRYGTSLSVALLDLDGFKAINDASSHAVGDAVLRRLVEVVTPLLRRGDLLARYGGEEFALVLTETSLPQGVAACEKLRAAIASHPWSEVYPDLAVTASFGVSADVSSGSWERMLAKADAQLYEAKAAGRNCVRPR